MLNEILPFRFALDFLNHPEKLQQMRDRLLSIRGQPGAAQKLAQLVGELVGSQSVSPP